MTIETLVSTEKVLIMSNVIKTFPGVQALRGVDFEVSQGEIHGLVGKNGAGKSTLVRVLMGLQDFDEGSIQINGTLFTRINSSEALQAGIAYVPQQVNMMDSLTVAENILAGNLPKNRFKMVDWRSVYSEAEERLKKLGLNLDVRKPVEGLRVAEQTMLAIAKALFSDAKLIILDETTASLPRADINQLFEFIHLLKEKGITFIYISHHLDEVFEICDRVTIMRDGQVVGTVPVNDLDMHKLTKLIVGEDLHEYERESTCKSGEKVLEIKDLSRRGHYENINFSIERGEIVGLSGLQGCGAEALAAGLFGLEPRGMGEVFICGKPFSGQNPKQALDQGLALLPQSRYRFGLVGLRSVRENITYTTLEHLSNLLGMIKIGIEKNIANQYIDELGIVTPNQEQCVKLLSGGNQQKVVFAKLASTKPDILILHEPNAGIDVRAKQDIFRIIDDLACNGHAILIVSSEVREMIGICDRILVMYQGRITHEFKKGNPNTIPNNILEAIEGDTEHAKR
ncbi:MAG TPA: sugar ABC transporter ATP-binding protein [Anaerolineaceae bacterium]|nr:sugar ABC transporter ATP-binding protein [Anaerolineaceae bacterium]